MNKKNISIIGIISLLILTLGGIFLFNQDEKNQKQVEALLTTEVTVPEGQEVATFAGGCFWCLEAVFQETDGVVDVVNGYAGGQEVNPTYEQVYKEQTGHRESVQIFYDPAQISYSELLDIYWYSIDPTDSQGQFVDKGMSYTSAIFYHNNKQKELAEQSKQDLIDSDIFEDEIVTPILPFTTFYKAEEYHQDFYLKSPDRFNSYESNSGREEFKEFIWGEIQRAEE